MNDLILIHKISYTIILFIFYLCVLDGTKLVKSILSFIVACLFWNVLPDPSLGLNQCYLSIRITIIIFILILTNQRSIKESAYFTIIPHLFLYAIDSVAIIWFSTHYNWNIEYSLLIETHYLITMCSELVMYAIVMLVIIFLYRKGYWLSNAFFLVSLDLIFDIAMNYLHYNKYSYYDMYWLYVSLFLLIAGVIESYIMIKKMKNSLRLKVQENENLESQLVSSKKYQESSEKIMMMRHDLKHIMENIDDNKSSVKDYMNQLNQTYIPIETGYKEIDKVINAEILKAKENDIEISAFVSIPNELRIEEMDVCILLTNLLDNAIIHIGGEKNNVFECVTKSNFIVIKVENTITDIVLDEKGKFLYKKQWSYGVRSIENIVSKYKGTVQYHQSNGRLSCEAALYNHCEF